MNGNAAATAVVHELVGCALVTFMIGVVVGVVVGLALLLLT